MTKKRFLPDQDRETLIEFTKAKRAAQLSDDDLIHRAARRSPAKETSHPRAGTVHHTYQIPAVSQETMEILYREIAQLQGEETTGLIRLNYSEKPPEKAKGDKGGWVTTPIAYAHEPDMTFEGYSETMIGTTAQAAQSILGYEFVFIDEVEPE